MSKNETLEQQRDRLMYERDQLAHAIAGAGIRTGGIREDAELTGPMLIQLVKDMADHINASQSPQAEYNMSMGKAADDYISSLSGIPPNFPADFRWHNVFDAMLAEQKPKKTKPAIEAPPLGVGTPIPKELVDVRWLNNAYLELQAAIYQACNRSSLENAVTRTAQSTNPHQALMKLTHQLGRTATPNGEDVQKPISSELKLTAMLDMQFDRYKQISEAIDQAGKGIGLSASQPLGKASHAEMLEFVTKIGDAAERQIAQMHAELDDDVSLSPR